MKTVLQRCVLFCSVSVSIAIFLGAAKHSSEKYTQKPLKVKLIVEDSINLTKHAVLKNTGDQQRAECHSKILVNCSTSLPEIIDSIQISHFDQLMDSAISINSTYTKRYILALRLIYGMDEAKNIQLIYQPLFLKNNSDDTVKINAVYTQDTSKLYYIYNRTTEIKFQTVDKPFVKAAVKRYRDNISFKTGSRKGTPMCRPFNNASDSTGDVNYNVFSFQEMRTVVRDQRATTLYILNASEVIRVKGIDYLKHIILLGSEKFNKKDFRKEYFYNKYGNLSHLCPPSCGAIKVSYNLQ